MIPSNLANLYLAMESVDHPGIEYCLLGKFINMSMSHGYHELTKISGDILMHETLIPLTVKSSEICSPINRKVHTFDLDKVDISKEMAMLSFLADIQADASRRKPSKIKRVIFNDPVTVVLWSDGDKTIVKAVNEPYDPEKGLAMAVTKKLLGNNKGSYYNEFKKWLPPKEVLTNG